MSDTTTLNLNAAECLRSIHHFGYTTIHNVCANTTYDLSWGFFDWLGIIGLVIVGIMSIGIFAFMLLMMLTEF